MQRARDAGAALPILDGRRGPRERLVGVAARELPRDVREPRSEQKRMDAPAVLRESVQEMQEKPAVLGHRSRYVDECHHWRMTLGARAKRKVDDRPSRAQRA